MSAAASAVTEGRYDIRVALAQLGEEFDELATAFNRMAERLQAVEIDPPPDVRRSRPRDPHSGGGAGGLPGSRRGRGETLDPQTVAMLREQTGRLVRFSADAAALAQAEEAHAVDRRGMGGRR